VFGQEQIRQPAGSSFRTDGPATARVYTDGIMDDMDSSAGQVYDVLCEMRDAIARDLSSRLEAAGYGDLSGDDLLTLTAMNLNRSEARTLIGQLGITGQTGSQSIKKMVLCGYLGFHDNPDKPRQSAIIITERGRAAFEEALSGLKAGDDSV
jgi:DNA-binding MarR family transcriptional regulator